MLDDTKLRILVVLSTSQTPVVTHTELCRQTGRIPVYERNAALDLLVNNGLISKTVRIAGNSRKSYQYVVTKQGLETVTKAVDDRQITVRKPLRKIAGSAVDLDAPAVD